MSRKRVVEEAKYLKIKGYSKLKTSELQSLLLAYNSKSTQTEDSVKCEACQREYYRQNLEHLTKKLSSCRHDVVVDNDDEVCCKCGLVFAHVVECHRR